MPEQELRGGDYVRCPLCARDARVEQLADTTVTINCFEQPEIPECFGIREYPKDRFR